MFVSHGAVLVFLLCIFLVYWRGVALLPAVGLLRFWDKKLYIYLTFLVLPPGLFPCWMLYLYITFMEVKYAYHSSEESRRFRYADRSAGAAERTVSGIR
ncbi:hypothetical protein C6H68_24460 [Photorhabdus luminescens]|nr:hypothetical protein C6H68_24460 [Photorhabdus luminescens]